MDLFLGADDSFYSKEVLSLLFDGSDFENINFLYGNVEREEFKDVYDGKFDYRKLLIKNISHQAIFYNRNLFQKVGKYDLQYKTHADWDFNLRCFEDKEIKIKYTDKIVARFGKGGLSGNYDIPFFRESLLPRKLSFLKNEKNRLYNLKSYDEWWRFIRNAGIRSENDFNNPGYHLAIPPVILSMVKRQNKLPESLLQKGVFSKMFMFINYFFSNHKICR